MAAGRPRNFNREEVLAKSVPVFWERGFADTSLADLEKATGVNRSGLYAEFKDKQDLFLAGLQYYLDTSGILNVLSAEPLGWQNVEEYLKFGLACWEGQKGCFSVNAMRELAVLPPEARALVNASMKPIRRLLVSNIKAASPEADANAQADMVMVFFSGISIEQNLAIDRTGGLRRIKTFMRTLIRS